MQASNKINSMPSFLASPKFREPILLTPGPLTTSIEVKESMLIDWGSWDQDFRDMTAKLRSELLNMVGAVNNDFDCVPMQGSGTFAVEAMLGSFLPKISKTLVLANGTYGLRIAKSLDYIGRDYQLLDKGDYLPPRGTEVAAILAADAQITHVVVVHCETSSGILNPVEEISKVVAEARCKLLIDTMSAFGAIDLNMQTIECEAFVSSANKCIEGVPGFGFIIARKTALEAAKGQCHSLSLDVYDQWQHMGKTGQWRFTPPTHVVAAFMQALEQHKAEGGVLGRGARYIQNRDILVAGMRNLGLETLLEDRWLSPIIVTFFNPSDDKFEFSRFYDQMKQRGFIIYPGKLTVVDSFRIGCIGHIDGNVMHQVVNAAKLSLAEMGVVDAAPPQEAITERAKLLNQ